MIPFAKILEQGKFINNDRKQIIGCRGLEVVGNRDDKGTCKSSVGDKSVSYLYCYGG